MRVLLAHNGKTVDVEVQPSTRVDALQALLASRTELRAAEQIVMCDGKPLDAAQPLSAYKLPWDESGQERDVFLYCKSHLRPGAPVPPPEALEPIHVDELAPGTVQYDAHPLDSAPSPLLRALPAYERDFRGHLRRGQALQAAGARRLAAAEQLLAEMNVQGLAIDAARSNVEKHYVYIQEACADFMRRYRAQAAAHEEVLNRFDRDMDALAAAELHPAARSAGCTRLLDLLPETKLRDWAADCRLAHRQFASKVAELEGLFGGLRADVEALFMQAPSADLEQLSARAQDVRLHLDEQAAIVATLESDFGRVQTLVEEGVRALSARPGAGSMGPLDAAGVMDTMHESHTGQLLPRLAANDAVLARFAKHCLECKNQMTREVVGQLRRISGQQSKISRARGQLSVFRQVASRQAEAIAELLLPRRLPAAYRHCLAECLRRKAFAELYAGQAGELAEKMARLRSKEAAARDAFRSAVERYIPPAMLAGLGLAARPPHCVVSVPQPDAGLAAVTPEDLKRAPASQQVQLATPFSAGDTPRSAGASPRAPPPVQAAPAGAAVGGAAADVAAADAAQGDVATDSPASLELENARLRSELATQVAMACLAEQERVGAGDAGRQRAASRQGSGGSPSSSQRGSGESLRRSGGESTADLAARFQAALAAKDDVAQRLGQELAEARQQAAAYEARIRQLEQHMARSVSGRSGPYFSGAASATTSRDIGSTSGFVSGAASGAVSGAVSGAYLSGGSPSASSHGSSAAASASSPSGHLPASAPSDSVPAGISVPPALQLDPVQRAASGTAVPPSADRPPLSPRPPAGSPRSPSAAGSAPAAAAVGSVAAAGSIAAATAAAATAAAVIGGAAVPVAAVTSAAEPLQLAASASPRFEAAAVSAPAASPEAVPSPRPSAFGAASASAAPADAATAEAADVPPPVAEAPAGLARRSSNAEIAGADVPAVQPIGGDQASNAAASSAEAPLQGGQASEQQQPQQQPADATRQDSGTEAHPVVPSPSLTSLADAAGSAVSVSSGSISTAVRVTSPEPAEPVATSGFRVTGFRVASAEQVPMPEGGSVSGGSAAGDAPQPTLPALATAAADEPSAATPPGQERQQQGPDDEAVSAAHAVDMLPLPLSPPFIDSGSAASLPSDVAAPSSTEHAASSFGDAAAQQAGESSAASFATALSQGPTTPAASTQDADVDAEALARQLAGGGATEQPSTDDLAASSAGGADSAMSI